MQEACEGAVKRRLHNPFTPVADPQPVTATVSTLVLVTGEGCHLCERGREVLAALEVRARELDVDSDEASALAADGVVLSFLPVLTDGRRVIAYGRFSERRLRKELGL